MLSYSPTLSRGHAAVRGLIAAAVGALVVWPGIGAVMLALVFGAYLAVAGVALLVSAAAAPHGRTVPSAA